jgi:hypothetical protein
MKLEDTIEKYWRAYNGHDLDAILTFMDEDVIIRFPTDPHPAQGKEQLRQRWTLMFTKVIPDISEEILTTVVQNNLAACEVIERGTFNLPPEAASTINISSFSRPYMMHLASLFRFNAKGLIEEIHSYWDTGTFSQQIGLDISHVRSLQSRAKELQ